MDVFLFTTKSLLLSLSAISLLIISSSSHSVIVESTSTSKPPNVTRIQFYMHDIVSGPNATAIQVAARLNRTGHSGSDPISDMFGSVFIMDNPLTATPDLKSMSVGRAQGMYAMSSREREFSMLMTLTFGISYGRYNGSSFSVIGRNPIMNEVREMPVVGGTGIFRLVRGYCLAKTFSFTDMDAVIGYNVTLIHDHLPNY